MQQYFSKRIGVLTFFIALLPVCLYGQQNFQVKLGDNLPIIKDSTYFFKIKANEFINTPYLYIVSEDVECKINSYSLSIFPERGEMWGPKEINGDDIYNILNNAYIKKIWPTFAKRVRHGDVFILDNITSNNIDCEILVKTIHIRLE